MRTEKRVFKYATGVTIPQGAIYLSTVTQTEDRGHACWYVWHYFLVDVVVE